MKHKIIIYVMTAILCGCGIQSSKLVSEPTNNSIIENNDSNTYDTIQTKNRADGLIVSDMIQTENQTAGSTVVSDLIPAGNGDLVLKPSTTVSYCNPTVSNTFIPYCSKSGCTHNSIDCSAYIGSADFFAVYKDIWYYVDTVHGESSTLYRHDPASNERTTLLSFNTTEEENAITYTYINGFMGSYDYLYLDLVHQIYSNTEQSTTISTDIVKMDVNSGEYEIMFTYGSDDSYSLIGGCGEEMVVVHSFNFYITNAEDSSGDIVFTSDNELLLYDLETMESEVIVDSTKGLQMYSDSFGNICGSNITYILESEIHLYNLDDHSDELVYTIAEDEELIRANIFGNLIYFITHDENGDGKYWVMNSDGTNVKQLENDGVTDVTVFGKYRTTENGYIGLYNSSAAWISVTDYLNEDYSNAIRLGA